MTPDHLADAIERIQLPSGAWIDHVGSCPSTMDLARGLARQGCAHLSTVWSEHQTQGRGRQGKAWHGQPGAGLCFSTVLRPQIMADQLGLLPLLAGATLCSTVRELGANAWLKWPNDLMVDGDGRPHKLAGILLEQDRASNSLILGVGLNIQKVESDQPTAWLEQFVANPDRSGLLQAFLTRCGFEIQQLEHSSQHAIGLWNNFQRTLGRTVRVQTSSEQFSGLASHLGPDGALCVQTETGIRVVRAGEVSLRF